MQYGHFDDPKKEYVITRPDTPKPWSNYLGDTEYGAIITNNAGGYSFFKQGGMGRFVRMRFNSVPLDQPGRYLYLHDREKKDYWSASWQPVGKPLEEYKSECRHGTAYTTISSDYDSIETETTYFVPLNKTYELWQMKVTNNDTVKRQLRGYTYVEYACSWNAIDDLLNLQYVMYTAQVGCEDGIIDHGTNVNIPEMPENFKEKDQGRHTFLALSGADVSGYDCDREAFLGGVYRSYANPSTVESGSATNSEAYGDNPCGCLQFDLDLEPGESRTVTVIMGIGKGQIEGKAVRDRYNKNPELPAEELQALKNHWHDQMEGLTANTPDEELNSTINTWGIYNSLITFSWSRAASLVYTGVDRDGLGYRDTVQDFLGVTHVIPEKTRERLELMITGQVSNGGAMPCVLPLSHTPGQEPEPAKEAYRSDDSLWLFNAIPLFVKETGDLGFYQKVLPYSDKGEDTVFAHMRRAIEFSLERSGAHGLPCGLHADWNDCLKFGYEGETVFVALQLRYGLSVYIDIAKLLGDSEEQKWGEEQLQVIDKNLQEHAWDGEWFMRGYRYDGLKFGSKEVPEGQIFLNPQTWGVISGAASQEQAEISLKKVRERLATDCGIALCDPPYTSSDWEIVRAQLMNPSLKENGGIFNHTQGWVVMAEAMLGNGNQAYEYLRSFLPAAFNQKAEVREIEPYVVCQSTHAKHSPKQGVSRLPWLSGAATWNYFSMTQYILGIRPEYDGLTIDPCIPSDWPEFTATRRYRNKLFKITVKNENASQYGVQSLSVNGTKVDGNKIPESLFELENEVLVIM